MNKLPALIFAAAALALSACGGNAWDLTDGNADPTAGIDPTDPWAIYDAARAEFDKDKWLHSKRFVLAQTTSTEGEGNIGQYPHFKQGKHIAGETMIYYVSTAECDSDKCRELQPYAEQIAGDFIAEYNALVGREVLRLGKDGGGDVPIYLRDTGKRIDGKGFNWNCPEENWVSHEMGDCSVYVTIPSGDDARIKRNLPRKIIGRILATLGLWGTSNAVFGDCATYYDRKYNKPGYGIRYAGKLCEYDIFAILFIDRHVKPGMTAAEINAVYEEDAESVRDEMIAEGLGK